MNPSGHLPATLAATGLRKSYGAGATRIDVLRDVSLEIFPGELTICVGPSGSGKSTLVAALSGLLRPDAGRVSLLGEDLSALGERARDAFRLRHCGFVFQGFNLFGALTAFENVLLPLTFMRVPADEAHARAGAALAEVGLDARAHLLPQALSGGEKQRTAIARAIVKRPRLIFADEPTSSLDRENGQRVIDILHRFARDHGATILAVTHDPRLLTHADRVIQFDDGAILADTRNPRALPPPSA
jgi:putative ABC transport system ATP-binding protein